MRVLIVSPHFPPSNSADMQRIRMLLPYLGEAGFEAEVLAVDADMVACPRDPWLEAGLPPGVPVHRVKAMSLGWARIPGLGILSYRALGALRRDGVRKLANAIRAGKPFDLVYFSTTQFGIHILGPHWKRRFGVPFVMDYQDPWVSDYYREHPQVRPPGGNLKFSVAHALARRTEPRVLRQCSGITSVSPSYRQQLLQRYPFLKTDWPVLVAPFPGDTRDLERVRADPSIRQSVFDPSDGLLHWVYVGVAGKIMERALRGLFLGLSKERRAANGEKEQELARLRLHFVGTSYAAAGRGVKSVEPLAQEYGLQDIVVEHTDRIPYSQTLRCLLDADALIVPGSDDPGYTASKIYPYLLADKPLLSVFHQNSSVVSLIRMVGGGTVVPFADGEQVEQLAEKIRQTLVDNSPLIPKVPLDQQAFVPFTAAAQAEQLANFFRHVLEAENRVVPSRGGR